MRLLLLFLSVDSNVSQICCLKLRDPEVSLARWVEGDGVFGPGLSHGRVVDPSERRQVPCQPLPSLTPLVSVGLLTI